MGNIQIAAYLPTKLAPLIQPHLDYAFLEPCENGEYVDYYRKLDGVKILDNGLIEYGESIDIQSLVEYARSVNATYIIPPDKLGDWAYNLLMAGALRYDYHISSNMILPCLGGPYFNDFVYQKEHLDYTDYGGVCLPYRLNRHPIHVHSSKRLHLLGLKWPERYGDYTKLASGVVSIDTTEFISASYASKNYRIEGFTTTKRIPEYTDLIEEEIDIPLIVENLNWLREAFK